MTTKIKSGLIADNAIISAHISSGAISSAHLSSIDTDNVSEGSSNLYFTTARARTSLSVTDSGGDGSLAYDNSTGAITYTGPSAAEVRAHISVTDSGGDGSLAYSNGVITYTGPSASEVRSHLSAGTGVTYSSGEFSIGQSVATTASPTFADINITGDLNLTGDINSYSVTDLDIVDQTITLGVGQSESASGGSGIVVAGSNASILWDETNTEFDLNNPLHITTAALATAHVTVQETSGATTSLKAGGSVGYVGTDSNHPLRIQANAGTKIYVATDGKIGIGSNHYNPLQTVDISGSAAGLNLQGGNNRIYFSNYRAIEGATDASLLQIGEGYTDITLHGNVGVNEINPDLKFHVNSGTANVAAKFESTDSIGAIMLADNSGNVELCAVGSDFQVRNAGSSSKLTVLNSSGFVGVGVGNTAPSSMLHITGNSDNGDGACQLIINDEDSDEGSRVPSIQFKGNGSNTTRMRGSPSGFYLSSSSAMNDDFIVKSDGLIGMGISPTTRLHMKGTGDMIRLESTNSGTGGAQIDMLHFSSSIANEDIQAMINMGGYYSGTASAYFGSMRCIATDAGARHGRLEFLTRDNTAFNTGLTIDHQPCVGIGTTTPVAKLDVIGHSPSTAPSVYDYLYANGSGIRVHGEEAGIDLVGLDDGGHSASVLLRNTNQGFGIFNVPNDDTLRIRSFDAQAQNFYIHSSGGNVANLTDILILDKTGNVGITATASLRFNGTGDNTHAVGYDSTIDGSFIRGQNGVRVITGTGGGAERVRFDTNGNIYAQSATQNRLVLGSTGGVGSVNNSTNWIRGSGGSLQFNAASTGYVWESGGTARLAMTSTGVITQTTAGTSDSYDMILRSTDSGDPGLAIVRDSAVGFGIAVRAASDDYVDFQVNNGGQPGYTETGKLRLYHNGNISIPGTALWSTGVGNTFGSTGNHYMIRTSSSVGNETIIINNTQAGSVGVLQYRESAAIKGSYFIATSANGIYSSSGSDYRFKENVATITEDYLTKLTSLRPITYTHSANYDDDTSTTHTGFIAHEVAEVFPEFVEGEKDAVWTQEELDGRGDPDTTNETAGDAKYQAVAYERKEWNVYIVRALQQLKAENDVLKARITELEG
jgi:hypothetical protein